MTEQPATEAAPRRERIEAFLRAELAGGEMSVIAIEARAKAAGLAGAVPFGFDKGFRRARQALGIGRERGTAYRRGRTWFWALPDKQAPGSNTGAAHSLPGPAASDAPPVTPTRVGAPQDSAPRASKPGNGAVRLAQPSEAAEVAGILLVGLRREPGREPDEAALGELLSVAWSRRGAVVVAIGAQPIEAVAVLRIVAPPWGGGLQIELTAAAEAHGFRGRGHLATLERHAIEHADACSLPLVGPGAVIHMPATVPSIAAPAPQAPAT